MILDEDDSDYGKCTEGCSLLINDFFCNACYKYKYDDDSTEVTMHRCMDCAYGFYPDIITGKC